MHLFKPTYCQYISVFEQGGNAYVLVLEQQQAAEIVSDCELYFSTLEEHFRDRYSCKIYDQFAKRV